MLSPLTRRLVVAVPLIVPVIVGCAACVVLAAAGNRSAQPTAASEAERGGEAAAIVRVRCELSSIDADGAQVRSRPELLLTCPSLGETGASIKANVDGRICQQSITAQIVEMTDRGPLVDVTVAHQTSTEADPHERLTITQSRRWVLVEDETKTVDLPIDTAQNESFRCALTMISD